MFFSDRSMQHRHHPAASPYSALSMQHRHPAASPWICGACDTKNAPGPNGAHRPCRVCTLVKPVVWKVQWGVRWEPLPADIALALEELRLADSPDAVKTVTIGDSHVFDIRRMECTSVAGHTAAISRLPTIVFAHEHRRFLNALAAAVSREPLDPFLLYRLVLCAPETTLFIPSATTKAEALEKILTCTGITVRLRCRVLVQKSLMAEDADERSTLQASAHALGIVDAALLGMDGKLGEIFRYNSPRYFNNLDLVDEAPPADAFHVAELLFAEHTLLSSENGGGEAIAVFAYWDSMSRFVPGGTLSLCRAAYVRALGCIRTAINANPAAAVFLHGRLRSEAEIKHLMFTFGKQALAEQLQLFFGNDGEAAAWYYVLVLGSIHHYRSCLDNAVITLLEHGNILDSGFGSEPPEERTLQVELRLGIRSKPDEENLFFSFGCLAHFLRSEESSPCTLLDALHRFAHDQSGILSFITPALPDDAGALNPYDPTDPCQLLTYMSNVCAQAESHASSGSVHPLVVDGLPLDAAAAIAAFTVEAPVAMADIVNAPFYAPEMACIYPEMRFQDHKPFLALLIRALHSLPPSLRYTGPAYRVMDLTAKPYLTSIIASASTMLTPGTVVTFAGITRLMIDKAAADASKGGLRFCIESVSGYNIAPLSVAPKVGEIVAVGPLELEVLRYERSAEVAHAGGTADGGLTVFVRILANDEPTTYL